LRDFDEIAARIGFADVKHDRFALDAFLTRNPSFLTGSCFDQRRAAPYLDGVRGMSRKPGDASRHRPDRVNKQRRTPMASKILSVTRTLAFLTLIMGTVALVKLGIVIEYLR
jgi:hypothetical protein